MLLLGILEDFFGDGLYDDHAVVLTPPVAQLKVHLALYVHEDHAARESDGDHDKLRPEGPVVLIQADFFNRFLYEYIQ